MVIPSTSTYFRVGSTFESSVEFFEKVKEFEEKCFVKLYKRSSRTIESTRCRATKKHFNDRLTYAEVDMACIHGGKNFKSTCTGQRPSTSTFQMKCPFALKVRASQDGEKLVVTALIDEHKHDVSEATFRHLPHQRKMDDEQKKQVKSMLEMKANKKLLQQHIRKETGRFVSLKDLHNLCGKEKGTETVNLEAVVNELRQSKDAVAEVLEQDGVLQGLFFQRREWQQTFKTFPEVILIDATYKLNNLGMPLYLVLCVDGNGESEIVALWIVRNEDKVTMRGMFEQFKRHNETRMTTCVMADKDWVERDVIEEQLSHATFLICLFHTLRTFRREVSEKGMGINQDQRVLALDLLEKLTYASSEEEYATHKEALLELGFEKVSEYFETNWDPIRHQWVEGLKNSTKHFMNNTNNRLESINQKIKDFVGRRLDLVQFFKELLKYFDSMTQERDHRAAMVFAKVPVNLYAEDNPLREYQRHLTPFAFVEVKRQHAMADSINIPQNSGMSIQMQRREGLLTVTTTSCQCGFYKAMSLPCRHIFAMRLQCNLELFQDDLCAHRWTRLYYKQHRVLVDPVEETNFDVRVSTAQASSRIPSQHQKYKSAFQHAQRLASMCSQLPLRQFFPALNVLEKLASAWQEGKHVSIEILHTAPDASHRQAPERDDPPPQSAQPQPQGNALQSVCSDSSEGNASHRQAPERDDPPPQSDQPQPQGNSLQSQQFCL